MKYKVEIKCAYSQWWRYNIFMTVVGRDNEGAQLSYSNLVNRVYDIGDGSEIRTAPQDYNNARPLSVTVDSCDYIDVYLYIIANTFPESLVIRDSPSFPIEVVVKRDSMVIERTTIDVNQWGGSTLIGRKYGQTKKLF